jgi:hypothetical protein
LTWALESTRSAPNSFRHKKSHLDVYRRIVERVCKNPAPSVKVLKGSQLGSLLWTVPAVLSSIGLFLFALAIMQRSYSDWLVKRDLFFGTFQIYGFVSVAGFVAVLTAIAVVARLEVTCILTAVNFAGVAALLHLGRVSWGPSTVAAALVTVPLIVTCSFRNMRYDDLPGITDKISRFSKDLVYSSFLWFKQTR